MLDFFLDPNSRVPSSDLAIQQLPKKLDTQLTSDGVQVTEAWGIFYQENWNCVLSAEFAFWCFVWDFEK